MPLSVTNRRSTNASSGNGLNSTRSVLEPTTVDPSGNHQRDDALDEHDAAGLPFPGSLASTTAPPALSSTTAPSVGTLSAFTPGMSATATTSGAVPSNVMDCWATNPEGPCTVTVPVTGPSAPGAATVMAPGPVAESDTMGQNHAEPVLVMGVAVAAIWMRRLSSMFASRVGLKWSKATPPTPMTITSARIGSRQACCDSVWDVPVPVSRGRLRITMVCRNCQARGCVDLSAN